jgi:hypothetical protein
VKGKNAYMVAQSLGRSLNRQRYNLSPTSTLVCFSNDKMNATFLLGIQIAMFLSEIALAIIALVNWLRNRATCWSSTNTMPRSTDRL